MMRPVSGATASGENRNWFFRSHRQSVVVNQRMITAPVRRNGVSGAGSGGHRHPLVGAAAGQGNETQHGLDAGNRQVIDIRVGECPVHVHLDEALGETGHTRAGVVLVGVHRLFVAHHGGGGGPARTQQGRALGFADGQVKQSHAGGFGRGPLGADGLQYVFSALGQP